MAPIYEYKAYAEGGAVKTGVIDADSPREARQRLRRDRILVSELRAKGGKKIKAKSDRSAGDSRGTPRPGRSPSSTGCARCGPPPAGPGGATSSSSRPSRARWARCSAPASRWPSP